AAVALTAGLLPTLAATPAQAVSPDIVIAEVYGGGGNAGATFRNDFVVLRNNGSAAVDVSSWTLQYASAAGTSWAVTPLMGIIAPGERYLVQQAAGTGGTTDLPTPNASGSTAMSATAGKVALVPSRTACTGTACADTPLRDFVGYGSTASTAESSPALGASNTMSVSRSSTGADTDQNGNDFTAGVPTPERTTSAPPPPPPAPVADCTAPGSALTTIPAVQGSGATSPLVGSQVQVEGVVVGDLENVEALGYFLQSETADADPATSEGLFVSSPATGTVTLGDRVRVVGTVNEQFGVTTLAASGVDLCAGGVALPPAAALALPSDDAARERLEGMRVTTSAPLTVTEHFNLDGFGELVLSSSGAQVQPTEVARPGSATATALIVANRLNRLTLDDGRAARNLRPVPYLTPTDPVRIGDRVTALEDVVLTFGFGSWRLQPADGDARDADATTFAATNPRPASPEPVGGTYQVGAFNVLNYFTTLTTQNPQARGATNAADFAEQERKIVVAINQLGADVVALQEIENSAALGEPVDEALSTLVDALNAANPDPGPWALVPSSTDLPAAS
ncbi:MAG: ExeM/NucH family extracellular endonuclease, partial [Pseudorhodobacter sp.]|nr:ExeM/NucH family extracellular endonuclease [Frankiaceae bacterium]